MKKIYYAHHMNKYDTNEEIKEINLIKEKFKDYLIINPNGWICQENSSQAIMNQCYHFVKMSDVTVFSSYNEIIGRGVYEEVTVALKNNKEVYYIFENNFYKINSKEFERVKKFNIIITNREYASVEDLEKYLRIRYEL